MTISTATFAGGCFWCIEAAFNSLAGVKQAISGYTGGSTASPTYKAICSGNTEHAEAVQITFDQEIISYQALLTVFFTLHDPSQLNKQGNDIGSQYRSAIFYHDLKQKALAEQLIDDLEDSHVFTGAIKTTVSAVQDFYPAEDYHQGYFINNRGQGYCEMVIAPKLNKFKQKYQSKLK